MLKDYFFWFSQPSSSLNSIDTTFGNIFLVLLILALLTYIAKRFVAHQVYLKLMLKLARMFLTIGLLGLFWYGFRYENVPIFGRRYWAGMVLIAALIWFGYIVKYLIMRFRSERDEYDKYLLNSKYLPKLK